MKPIIFPLTTLIAMGCWYFVNNQKIGDLKESLTQNDTTAAPLQQVSENPEKAFIGLDGGLELERVGRFLTKVSKGETKSNGGNAWLWTAQQLSLMDENRLLELYNELKNTKLPSRERSKMESMILGHLGNKAPELYLQRFGIKTDSHYNIAASAFRQLMKKDSPSAIAWFDEYLKKTNLGENEASNNRSARVAFEKTIAEKLYPDDIEALGKRFQNLHEDQIVTILNSLKHSSREKFPPYFLKLIRDSLPEDQATNFISNAVSNITYRKELPEVAKIIAEHSLTPPEETAFYKYLANGFAWESDGQIENLETILPFLKEQGVAAPAEVFAKGVSEFYRNDLRGTGDLTKIYSYVREMGESQNLQNLLPAFVDQTTSRVCECCSLKGRLSRISDQGLRNQISAAYQQNLDSSK